MKILFCFSGFTRKNIQLQPWLTVYRVALYLIRSGHSVHVLTDVYNEEKEYDHICLHSVDSLRNTYAKDIKYEILNVNPDIIFISVTPCSLTFNSWYDILSRYTSYCFASYPFYGYKEMKKSFFHLLLYDKFQYGKNMLISKKRWSAKIKKNFCGVICQSEYTKNEIQKKIAYSIGVHAIHPGIDSDFFQKNQKKVKKDTKTIFIYAGSLYKIRGFELILKAFNAVRDPNVVLKILARGASDDQVCEIRKKFSSSSIDLKIYGGWLDKKSVAGLIAGADVTLLPFLLVPSELPVTVMESVALGTPVIVSDLVGLPEVAGEAGLVVEQCSAVSLFRAVMAIHEDHDLLERLRQGCFRQREKYLSWEEVGARWLDVVEGADR